MNKYVAIDIETTGLDSEKHQILEFAAVVGDFSKEKVENFPYFRRFFYYDTIIGDPFAIYMNREIIGRMSKRKEVIGAPWIHIDSLWSSFSGWLEEISMFPNRGGCQLKKLPVTGKNFSRFDARFLEKAPRFNVEMFHHRVLDIGSLYFEPEIDDVLPSLQECINKSGLQKKATSFCATLDENSLHSALTDCRAVIELIQHYYAEYKFESAFHSLYKNRVIGFDEYERLCKVVS